MPQAIHLDTNYLIYYVGGGKPEIIKQVEIWMKQGISIHASVMTWAEFQCGPLNPEENTVATNLLRSILPVTPELAQNAGHLFHLTGRRTRSLPDCVIAATAIHAGVPLATNNLSDFTPFLPHGLEIV